MQDRLVGIQKEVKKQQLTINSKAITVKIFKEMNKKVRVRPIITMVVEIMVIENKM